MSTKSSLTKLGESFNCGISHDIITGFPNESEDDHKLTLELMNYVKYDFGFMFKYSERPGTPAYKKLDDNVPEKKNKKGYKKSLTYNKNIVLII